MHYICIDLHYKCKFSNLVYILFENPSIDIALSDHIDICWLKKKHCLYFGQDNPRILCSYKQKMTKYLCWNTLVKITCLLLRHQTIAFNFVSALMRFKHVTSLPRCLPILQLSLKSKDLLNDKMEFKDKV